MTAPTWRSSDRGKIVLVTGGARSGKSDFAQDMAERLGARRLYVATCPALDDEIRARIERHRAARSGRGWTTVEEQIDLARALADADADVCLIDCLTLWINNLVYGAGQRGEIVSEKDVARQATGLLDACRGGVPDVVLVTNEVGMGVIPADAPTRHFRDLAGRCNQVVAREADTVVMTLSGIATYLKGSDPTR